MVLGITGGICTGKSTVLCILKEFGIKVVDLDEISHEIINQEEVKKEITEKIADVVEDGVVNRRKLGMIVFGNKGKLKVLNSIMHKRIIDKMVSMIKEHKEGILAVEVPLMYELGLEKYFDKVLLAYAPRSVQLERIQERDKKSKEEAINILNNQMDIEEKKKLADYSTDNTKSLEELREQIERILNENTKV